MINEEKYLDLIEKSLIGSASAAEKALISELLDSDLEFKQLYESERMIHGAIVLSELKEIEKEVRNFVPKRTSFLRKYWWGLGLVVVALIGGGYYSLLMNRWKDMTLSLRKTSILKTSKKNKQKFLRKIKRNM